MQSKKGRLLYIIFILIYSSLFIYNIINNSSWYFDNLFTIIILTILYKINKWMKIRKSEFLLFNLAFLTHNLGTFGFYSFNFGIIGYDDIVHFSNSFIGAYILFNFIVKKLCVKNKKPLEKNIIDENLLLFIFFVLGAVSALGAFIEITEYLGSVYLGNGEGIFFLGEGDFSKFGANDSYSDTMQDIITNTLGAISGIISFYLIKYKNKSWTKDFCCAKLN